MRIARADGRSLRSRSIVAAFAMATIPLLLSVFFITFSNEVVGVWLFLLVGIPALLGGILVVLAGNGVRASGSKVGDFFNEANESRRINLRRRALWVAAGLLVAIGALVAFVGNPFSHDEAESPAGSPRQFNADNFANIRGELRENSLRSPLGSVGDCVTLAGTSRNDATAQRINCGDKAAAYRIFQLAEQPGDCAADSDQRYAPKQTDEGRFILCLDYNWAHGLCIFPGSAHGRWHAVRDDCSSGGERPIEVQYDTANAQGCATGGYPHQVRRFTICATQLS